jgi:D-glycero-D-manno-heptose 1,7-bisphosphate phosphatase
MKNKALFLDRDGVINSDFGYVHKKENFEFLDDIFEIVSEAIRVGFKIFVVTNQAGIARGYYDEEQFKNLTSWMLEEFEKKGCCIDKVYYSPYHPFKGIGSYKKDHWSRKPNPGMILQAKDEFNIDLGNSIIIGDNESDMIAGIRAGIANLILYTKEPISSENAKLLKDCILIKELSIAKEIICRFKDE